MELIYEFAKNHRPIDFPYEVELKEEDYLQYIEPCVLSGKESEEKRGIIKEALRDLYLNDLIDLERLEKDPDFASFIYERYEEEALRAFEGEL